MEKIDRDLSIDSLPCENLPMRENCNGFDMESMVAFEILMPSSPLSDVEGKMMKAEEVEGEAFFWKREENDFFGEDEEAATGDAAVSPLIMGSDSSPRRCTSHEALREASTKWR